jgi:hypothetical protein
MKKLMNAWKSGEAGRQMPPVIVEGAKGTPSVHNAARRIGLQRTLAEGVKPSTVVAGPNLKNLLMPPNEYA